MYLRLPTKIGTDHMTATLPAPKSIDHRDKTQRKSLLGTCAVHFVHDGIGDALYVLLPIWGQAFALSYTQIGMLRAAYSTSLAFLQMPAGLLAERVGVVRLLVAGTIVAGTGFALLATASSFVNLGMLILLAGIGSSVQHPLSSEIISRAYSAATRRAALGVYNFSGDLGKMAVTAAVGLGVAMIGWANTAIAYGVVVGLVGLLASYALRHLSNFDRGTGSVSKTAVATGWGFTNAQAFALLSGIHIIDSACRTGLLTFLPFLLIASGAAPTTIGFGLALVFVGGALGKLVCGLLAERVGVIRTVVITELATGALILSAVLAPLAGQLVLLVPLGIALNGTSPVLYGTVAEFVREDRQGRSFGLFYTLGSAASVTAPFLFGIVSDAIGVPKALLGIAGLAVATIPLAALLRGHVQTR
jgi:MFS transporter, FSR family, fosmidomycin resistance protein